MQDHKALQNEAGGTPRNMSYTSRYSAKYRNSKSYPFHKGLKKETDISLDEISPEEVKIPKQFIHDTLNPKIWTDYTLNPEVRKRLLKIASEFYKFLEIKAPVKSIKLIGSMANFNWSSQSDIDLHLFFDFSEINSDTDLVGNYLFSKKSLWNERHNIQVKGYSVELYAQDINEKPYSAAIYDLLKNEWEIKPTIENFGIDKTTLISKVVSIINCIENLESEKNEPESIFEKGSDLKEKIRKMRQSGLEQGGEFSLENLAFKFLRNNDYIKRLVDLTKTAYDDNLSLKEQNKSEVKFLNEVVYPKKKLLTSSSTLSRVNESVLLNKSKHKLYITKSVDNLDESKIKLIAEFIKFCAKHLGIIQPCCVYLTGKRGGPIQTTASFNPNTNEIWIYVKNRNMLADPLRSLAHEIRHMKQNLDNVLNPDSGNDGAPHENEAHAFSGLMIRLFGKLHPEIFE